MTEQTTLLTEDIDSKGSKIIETQLERESKGRKKEYSIDYCLKQIAEEECLWDLRWWKTDHDPREVFNWLQKTKAGPALGKNCGHTHHCMWVLLVDHKFPLGKVLNQVLENNKISYKEHLGSCFFCQCCGKTFKEEAFSCVCIDCEQKHWDQNFNKFNLLNTKFGEHGFCKEYEEWDEEDSFKEEDSINPDFDIINQEVFFLSTSSKKYSKKIAEILNSGHTDCKRVEDVFNIHNSIKLKEGLK